MRPIAASLVVLAALTGLPAVAASLADSCFVAPQPLATNVLAEARIWLWQEPEFRDAHARLMVRFADDHPYAPGALGARDFYCNVNDPTVSCFDPCSSATMVLLDEGDHWTLASRDLAVGPPEALNPDGTGSFTETSPICGWLGDITSTDPEHPPEAPMRLAMQPAAPGDCADFAPAPWPDPYDQRSCWAADWPAGAIPGTELQALRLRFYHVIEQDQWYVDVAAHLGLYSPRGMDVSGFLDCAAGGWPADGTPWRCSEQRDGAKGEVIRNGDRLTFRFDHVGLWGPGGWDPRAPEFGLLPVKPAPDGFGYAMQALTLTAAPLSACDLRPPDK